MEDKVVVITGASDGIGASAARRLHAQGAKVVVVGRSPEKTRAVAQDVGGRFYLADFTKLDEVRRLAADLRRDWPRIDVLANNAGGIFGSREITVDGHEKTFQVNHLAPFLLTNLLIDVLVASRATVINTSSVAHRLLASFDLDDLDGARRYSAQAAYGNAKLENILFTRELHRRYHAQGLGVAAFHPGVVASNFASGSTRLWTFLYHTFVARFMISSDQGADTLVWLATSEPGKDWPSGEYFYKRKRTPVTKVAQDPEAARRLWDLSARFTALG